MSTSTKSGQSRSGHGPSRDRDSYGLIGRDRDHRHREQSRSPDRARDGDRGKDRDSALDRSKEKDHRRPGWALPQKPVATLSGPQAQKGLKTRAPSAGTKPAVSLPSTKAGAAMASPVTKSPSMANAPSLSTGQVRGTQSLTTQDVSHKGYHELLRVALVWLQHRQSVSKADNRLRDLQVNHARVRDRHPDMPAADKHLPSIETAERELKSAEKLAQEQDDLMAKEVQDFISQLRSNQSTDEASILQVVTTRLGPLETQQHSLQERQAQMGAKLDKKATDWARSQRAFQESADQESAALAKRLDKLEKQQAAFKEENQLLRKEFEMREAASKQQNKLLLERLEAQQGASKQEDQLLRGELEKTVKLAATAYNSACNAKALASKVADDYGKAQQDFQGLREDQGVVETKAEADRAKQNALWSAQQSETAKLSGRISQLEADKQATDAMRDDIGRIQDIVTKLTAEKQALEAEFDKIFWDIDSMNKKHDDCANFRATTESRLSEVGALGGHSPVTKQEPAVGSDCSLATETAKLANDINTKLNKFIKTMQQYGDQSATQFGGLVDGCKKDIEDVRSKLAHLEQLVSKDGSNEAVPSLDIKQMLERVEQLAAKQDTLSSLVAIPTAIDNVYARMEGLEQLFKTLNSQFLGVKTETLFNAILEHFSRRFPENHAASLFQHDREISEIRDGYTVIKRDHSEMKKDVDQIKAGLEGLQSDDRGSKRRRTDLAGFSMAANGHH